MQRMIGPAVVLAVLAAACTADGAGTSTTRAATTTVAATTDEPAATTMTMTGEAGGQGATTTTLSVPLDATPSQQEGPYYPVEKLDDRDNDMTQVEGLDGTAAGNVLLVEGRLLTTAGDSVNGAVVEMWQTDSNGIYLHPQDPGTDDRDPFFQFYGEAITDSDGSWRFRTIDPGYYEPRPRHLHVKVKTGDEVVLTTQIYFSDDPQAGGLDPLLVAGIGSGTDEDGAEMLVAEHVIVLDG
jgi:protocatechuate 3,4-dioxygenase beta subunit